MQKHPIPVSQCMIVV